MSLRQQTFMTISLKEEVYLEPWHVSMMETFPKIVYGQKPLTIYAKKLRHKCFAGY